MASGNGVAIPGRRVDFGSVFYTDWIDRGGDCLILRGDLLQKSSATGSIDVGVETRSEEDPTAAVTITATQALSMNGVGSPFTGLWLADSTNTAAKGVREQVRFKITFSGGVAGDFHVARLFAPIFFDNSKSL